ncbi:mechanosensitive ion channel family protein [Desulfoluna spongiiphila]|uniref:MscS family membrane protein n=1 Tax=Desulfoluna spongiiphila TaxID=419481 RepID=A0A1G5JCF2_9BACT|nr:mechanosensitive ion channel family protein [Desulfoluna spongiiphila]SCY85992.1 MscS family membrane protein [Desulfoluna spongiiphila]VVS90823.1 mechanosensitive ion channel mscs [Desulfoluna spongiiphila]
MEQLKAFGDLILDVWKNGLFGIDIGRILVAMVIFMAFLLLRKTISKSILNRLKRLTSRTNTELDDKILTALEPPLNLLPVILGLFFARQYLGFEGTAAILLDKLIRSLMAFTIFWSFFNIILPISHLFKKLEAIFDRSLLDWFFNATRAALALIGAATILEIWGIRVGPIIAGLGLFGVAVALGAQDLFKNLISGILILAERRFKIGDWIQVSGVVEGTVEQIGFRSTRIRRFDKAPVFVPNTLLSDNTVTNFTSMTFRRISWLVGLEYRTTVSQLRAIRERIEAWITEHEGFVNPPSAPLFVRIDNFSDSSIDIKIYCFTRTTVWGEWLERKEELICAIKEIVEEEGSGFAFPSQSLYVETMPWEERPMEAQGNAPEQILTQASTGSD